MTRRAGWRDYRPSLPGDPPLSAPIKIAIAGALGRMGRAVAAVVEQQEGLDLVGRFDRPTATDPSLTDAETALDAADVVIDFSSPGGSAALAARCAERGGPALVIGSTGFEESHIAQINAAARSVAIVRAGNFSLGVNMLMGLVAQAARMLPPEEYDIEVFEAHHRRKVDAPSGTALMLGEAAAEGRHVQLSDVAVRVRDGITGPRRTGDIGFSVLRGGGIIGEHSVSFVSDEEILTLSHSARDRGLFAKGAVAAARWVAGRAAGAYDMQNVLGFKA